MDTFLPPLPPQVSKHNGWTRYIDELERLCCYALDALISRAPEDKNPSAQCSVVLDLTNMGALSMDIQAIKKLLQLLGEHYVERCVLWVAKAGTGLRSSINGQAINKLCSCWSSRVRSIAVEHSVEHSAVCRAECRAVRYVEQSAEQCVRSSTVQSIACRRLTRKGMYYLGSTTFMHWVACVR
eukprot:1159356-Pelagomonas_calceolata.AAC.2